MSGWVLRSAGVVGVCQLFIIYLNRPGKQPSNTCSIQCKQLS